MPRHLFYNLLPAVSLLGACAPVASPLTAQFSLGPAASQAAEAPMREVSVAHLAPAPSPSVPAPRVVATGGAGGIATPPIGDSYFLLPDGTRLPAPTGDAVPVPQGLDGLVSYFAPGRVPCTVLADARAALVMHPRAVNPPAAPNGDARLTGQVVPASPDLLVSFYAPGQSDLVATTTASDGRFELDVPVNGEVRGMLVASDRQATPRLALAAVDLSSGASATAPPLSLASPTASPVPPPNPPDGLSLVQRTLSAFSTPPQRDAGGFVWGAPLLVGAPDQNVQYAFDGFTLATGYVAESSDQRAGSVVGGGQPLPPFLVPPDLSQLPTTLTAGQTLNFGAVPGAKLYTVSLSAPGHPAPLWEGATSAPHLALPTGLALDGVSAVRVCAWDAPGLDVYSVAALRALRLPVSSLPEGRFSWSERALGVSSK